MIAGNGDELAIRPLVTSATVETLQTHDLPQTSRVTIDTPIDIILPLSSTLTDEGNCFYSFSFTASMIFNILTFI